MPERRQWHDLLQPLTVCQSSLLTVFQRDMEAIVSTMNSVRDDAQLANVDLQNVLQKQQQTLQMMSVICKMLDDTAMAIVRSMKG